MEEFEFNQFNVRMTRKLSFLAMIMLTELPSASLAEGKF